MPKNIVKEFIVDDLGTPPVEPNSAYLTPVDTDTHYRTVADEDGIASVQIDPTVPNEVRNITQGDINHWNSNSGDDKNYIHIQSVPSAVWDIIHPLGKRPSVTVLDSTGRIMISTVNYVGTNRIIIKHAGAISGEALLN